MRRIRNWIRRWSFLILVLLFGAGYFTLEGQWKVYAEPLGRLRDVCENILSAEGRGKGDPDTEIPDSVSGNREGGNVSGGDGQKGQAPVPAPDANVPDSEGTAENSTVSGSEEAPVYRNPEDVVYQTVEDDYFADAVFIGDSRTVGLFEYGDLEDTTTFAASTGLTVYKMFDSPIVSVPGQKEKQTVEQLLSENSFSKIYLMIGINEMGTGDVDSFMEAYEQAVAHLRELQPDAVIYLQAIMKVTTKRSEKGDYINNPGIDARNERIALLADNVHTYYLDVNPLICDETGGMEPSYTFDGVHLKAQFIPIWKDFLKSHAVAVTSP